MAALGAFRQPEPDPNPEARAAQQGQHALLHRAPAVRGPVRPLFPLPPEEAGGREQGGLRAEDEAAEEEEEGRAKDVKVCSL